MTSPNMMGLGGDSCTTCGEVWKKCPGHDSLLRFPGLSALGGPSLSLPVPSMPNWALPEYKYPQCYVPPAAMVVPGGTVKKNTMIELIIEGLGMNKENKLIAAFLTYVHEHSWASKTLYNWAAADEIIVTGLAYAVLDSPCQEADWWQEICEICMGFNGKFIGDAVSEDVTDLIREKFQGTLKAIQTELKLVDWGDEYTEVRAMAALAHDEKILKKMGFTGSVGEPVKNVEEIVIQGVSKFFAKDSNMDLLELIDELLHDIYPQSTIDGGGSGRRMREAEMSIGVRAGILMKICPQLDGCLCGNKARVKEIPKLSEPMFTATQMAGNVGLPPLPALPVFVPVNTYLM